MIEIPDPLVFIYMYQHAVLMFILVLAKLVVGKLFKRTDWFY